MKHAAVLLLAASTVLTAWAADGPQANAKIVGKLMDVQGLVTVSSGNQMFNAASGAPLVVGSRIITTSSGAVTLAFDNACDIKLKPNQSITVKEGIPCAALLASVQPVGVPGAAQAAAAVGTSDYVIGGVALAAILLIADNDKHSPN